MEEFDDNGNDSDEEEEEDDDDEEEEADVVACGSVPWSWSRVWAKSV